MEALWSQFEGVMAKDAVTETDTKEAEVPDRNNADA